MASKTSFKVYNKKFLIKTNTSSQPKFQQTQTTVHTRLNFEDFIYRHILS